MSDSPLKSHPARKGSKQSSAASPLTWQINARATIQARILITVVIIHRLSLRLRLQNESRSSSASRGLDCRLTFAAGEAFATFTFERANA